MSCCSFTFFAFVFGFPLDEAVPDGDVEIDGEIDGEDDGELDGDPDGAFDGELLG